MRTVLLASLLLTACNDGTHHSGPPIMGDDDPQVDAGHVVDTAPALQCGTMGAGTVEGAIGGRAFGTVVSSVAKQSSGTNIGLAIGVFDSVVGCSGSSSGTSIVAAICDPTVASYDISGELTTCPRTTAIALYSTSGGGSMPATGGTVTIVSKTATCITGSMQVDLDSDTLHVNFAATICP